MIDPKSVSAVLVTRGDVDLSEILASITDAGIDDIVIWNNAEREDLSCYGRYAGIQEAKNEFIYHQDDDLISPVSDILAAYDPVADRGTIVCNNRAEEEWLLTAIGCVFHRDLADCFDEYITTFGYDSDFHRVSDVVFAYQHPYRRIVLPYRDLPWGFATEENPRMYGQPDHYDVRIRARTRVLQMIGESSGRTLA